MSWHTGISEHPNAFQQEPRAVNKAALSECWGRKTVERWLKHLHAFIASLSVGLLVHPTVGSFSSKSTMHIDLHLCVCVGVSQRLIFNGSLMT